MGIINIQEVLYNIGINLTSRAEQVSPKNYVELARVLHSKMQISNISNIY
jgi:16S rRNA A1518/A1519 N6-dimethyltransferase RsmA/KsgA/DIM1 with predicted DNA glycosylase/AP lyase activity